MLLKEFLVIERLHMLLERARVPLHGVRLVGGVFVPEFKEDATAEQQETAKEIINSFNPDSKESRAYFAMKSKKIGSVEAF